MLTVVAFVVALGLLVAVHEYGHYRMAVACGVKVLRFSVGFGKTLAKWTPKGSSTEFILAAFPLGGYVKMLDEREAPVAPNERHLAFNTQPLRSRVAIVAAGPIANLLLAVVLYAAVNWTGVEHPRAILASPVPGSAAQLAGLAGAEHVRTAGFVGEAQQEIASFEDLRWLLTRGALEGRDVTVGVTKKPDAPIDQVLIRLSAIGASEADDKLFRKIGIVSPWTLPVIGEMTDGSAAARSGLRQGDVVLTIGTTSVVDAQQLRELIRASVDGSEPVTQRWRVARDGSTLDLEVRTDARQDGKTWVGRIGAFVGAPPEMVMVRFGMMDGLWNGVVRTWQMSVLTLQMMGRMVIGEASLKNLSGPLTIADYAG